MQKQDIGQKSQEVMLVGYIQKLNLPNYNLKQCLFGEHLLSEIPTKPVAIVESEKSALVATHYMPEFIWLATGGIHGCFNSDVVKCVERSVSYAMPGFGCKERFGKNQDGLYSFPYVLKLY